METIQNETFKGGLLGDRPVKKMWTNTYIDFLQKKKKHNHVPYVKWIGVLMILVSDCNDFIDCCSYWWTVEHILALKVLFLLFIMTSSLGYGIFITWLLYGACACASWSATGLQFCWDSHARRGVIATYCILFLLQISTSHFKGNLFWLHNPFGISDFCPLWCSVF